jgi:hypothetical protein
LYVIFQNGQNSVQSKIIKKNSKLNQKLILVIDKMQYFDNNFDVEGSIFSISNFLVQIWKHDSLEELVASLKIDIFDLKNNETIIYEKNFENLGSITFEVTLKEDLEKKNLMARNVVYNKLKNSLFKKNKNDEILDSLADNLSGKIEFDSN